MRYHTTTCPVIDGNGKQIGFEQIDVPFTTEEEAEADAREAEWFIANDIAVTNNKIDQLWRAADAYVSSYISGVAIGLLTIGVIQSLPKSQAVTAWSQQVWAEYYVRKADVTVTSVVNTDFSRFGPMPYSVPELQAELGM